MANILVVDDDKVLCSMLVRYLESAGHTVTCRYSLADGCDVVRGGDFDVVFLDVQLPDGNGLDSLCHFGDARSTPEIIIMTGSGDSDGAKKAIKKGAWCYLRKPHVLEDMLLPLTRALEYRKQKQIIPPVRIIFKRKQIIGDSQAITTCLDDLACAATGDASVLITGATGTGKELFARALHENSKRADKQFVTVDCAALPDTLIESTLFGHMQGAFTGAEKSEPGLIHLANSGTLFLDEIGELPMEVQKRFLRVIEEGKYRPIGSTKEVRSDFRVVVATNRDLDAMSKAGTFRADLLFRLRSFHISLPLLTARSEDIPLLARSIVTHLCDRLHIEQKTLTTNAIEHLQAYEWPGNVRELSQVLEETCARGYQSQTIFANHLPEYIRVHLAQHQFQKASAGEAKTPSQPSCLSKTVPWKEYKKIMEKEYIARVMASAKGNIQEVCKLSGLSRARVYQLLNKTGYEN